MSPTKEALDSVYRIALFLSIFPALWMAGEIILSRAPTDQLSPTGFPTSHITREILILYWIVLLILAAIYWVINARLSSWENKTLYEND